MLFLDIENLEAFLPVEEGKDMSILFLPFLLLFLLGLTKLESALGSLRSLTHFLYSVLATRFIVFSTLAPLAILTEVEVAGANSLCQISEPKHNIIQTEETAVESDTVPHLLVYRQQAFDRLSIH